MYASTVNRMKMTLTMNKEFIKDNFDINIYDSAQYENPGCDEHVWKLCPYSIDNEYNRINEMSEFNLTLTDEEAKALTLGWGEDLGGDYCEDEDFWVDAYTFKTIYKDIPKDVKTWLDFVTLNL